MSTHEAEISPRGCTLASVLTGGLMIVGYALVVQFGYRYAGIRGLAVAAVAGVPVAMVAATAVVVLLGWLFLAAYAIARPREFLQTLRERRGGGDRPGLANGEPARDDSSREPGSPAGG